MTAYYTGDCGVGLSQKLTIPTTPTALEYFLNPEDLDFSDEDAGVSISIKYDRFTRDISAVMPVFTVVLRDILATEVYQITQFAQSDFLNTVLTTGKGSISLYYQNQLLEGLYIQPPIEKSSSWFDATQIPPVEIFDSITLKLASPTPRWF